MSLTFFKPNSKNTGHLFKFNFGPEKKKEAGNACYVEAVKQTGWNEKQKIGSFANSKHKMVVKLNVIEAAGIVDKINKAQAFIPVNVKFVESTISSENTNSEGYKFYHCKFYHASEQGNTTITFGPWLKNYVILGYWLNINKTSPSGSEKYALPLTSEEAELLKIFLQDGIVSHFKLVDGIERERILAMRKNQDFKTNSISGNQSDNKSINTPKKEEEEEEDNPFENPVIQNENLELSDEENPFL